MRPIELLAPAKTADIGIEAIRHGADAVYIGASAWGARAAAGNSVEDIERLVAFAHLYKAKVYVTVNTLIFDKEMQEVERLIWQLHDIGVDALIVQDLRLLSLNLPPIPLHASTQMDNRTVEKVQMLEELGFPQVVLARELTIEEITEIHEKCPGTKLEVFVHGALCVSLSGRCNASEALFGRSANRGECAQVCRMAFDLLVDGKTVMRDKHLLSLKDNCQIDHLEVLLKAGASSLKIEGRLKDVDYVKNVTAAYSEALNKLIAKHPKEFCRASSGHVNLLCKPSAERKISVVIDVYEDHITMTDEDGLTASVNIEETFELARTHQQDNIIRQLSKLGDTIFEAQQVTIHPTKNYFIPSSMLSQWRRQLSAGLTEERRKFYPLERQAHTPVTIETETPYEQTHDKDTPVMISKYCIRRQLDMCLRTKTTGRKESWMLKLANGKSFRLDFDCKNCFMRLYQQ